MSAIAMTWRNLSRRKLRVGLTVAGIAVGVALILVLLSLVAGIDAQVRTSIRALGGADIIVYNATITNPREAFLLGSSAVLNESTVETVAKLPNVHAVSPQLTEVVVVNETLAPVWGIDVRTFNETAGGLNIIDGKMIGENDNNSAVLGKNLFDLFNMSIGQSILIRTRPPHHNNNATLTVVGVYETGVFLTDRGLYIPITVAQNLTDSFGFVTSILVKADSPDNVEAVSSEIASLFPGMRVLTLSNVVAQASQLLNTLTMFFGTLGIVALVAGSFGVVNTMIISIMERTREIGTLKAIGAKNSTVLKIFILEALLLGCLGGGIGIIVGGASSYLISEFSVRILPAVPVGQRITANVSPMLTPSNIVLSFVLGLVTGVLAGIYPAWRAARMKPVEALRHG
jgi:putative ABC transport system permease protein